MEVSTELVDDLATAMVSTGTSVMDDNEVTTGFITVILASVTLLAAVAEDSAVTVDGDDDVVTAILSTA